MPSLITTITQRLRTMARDMTTVASVLQRPSVISKDDVQAIRTLNEWAVKLHGTAVLVEALPDQRMIEFSQDEARELLYFREFVAGNPKTAQAVGAATALALLDRMEKVLTAPQGK